jgi:imidazolonepropionase-like amidohydrolase
VLVLEGVVAHVGRECPPVVPEGLPVFEGGWLAEPLADAHVHLFLSGSLNSGERARLSALGRDEALDRALRLLEEYRRAGIAAVRDGGDPSGLALAAAAVANGQPRRFAAVLPAGEPVYRRGFYGSFLGRGVSSAVEGAELLRKNLRDGATHAKILATGLNSLENAGEVGPGGFAASELRRLLEAADELALPVMLHANGPLAVLPRAPGSLEHGFGSDVETLRETGAAWTPTLGAWAELECRSGLSPAQRSTIARTDATQRQEVVRAFGLGLELRAGSDAGTPGVAHGSGLLGEIRRLAEAGLPPEAALAAATCSAREACERELGRALGSLDPGAPAGFAWFDEDPAADLGELFRPRVAFVGGAWTAEPPPSDLRKVW